MIDKTILKQAVDIITEKILTPIIYMYEEEAVEFICFFDSNIAQEDIDSAEREVYQELNIQCELIDLREFSEEDRLKITSTAQVVYAADALVQLMFQNAMMVDIHRVINERNDIVQRKRETGSYYLN